MNTNIATKEDYTVKWYMDVYSFNNVKNITHLGNGDNIFYANILNNLGEKVETIKVNIYYLSLYTYSFYSAPSDYVRNGNSSIEPIVMTAVENTKVDPLMISNGKYVFDKWLDSWGNEFDFSTLRQLKIEHSMLIIRILTSS